MGAPSARAILGQACRTLTGISAKPRRIGASCPRTYVGSASGSLPTPYRQWRYLRKRPRSFLGAAQEFGRTRLRRVPRTQKERPCKCLGLQMTFLMSSESSHRARRTVVGGFHKLTATMNSARYIGHHVTLHSDSLSVCLEG